MEDKEFNELWQEYFGERTVINAAEAVVFLEKLGIYNTDEDEVFDVLGIS